MASVAVATKKVPPPYEFQREAVAAARKDLAEKGGALVVVPTGGGKSLIMGIVVDEELDEFSEAKVMVLQHNGELLDQNFRTISSVVAPKGTTVSIVQARLNDFDGQIIFGSTPTFRRESRREQIPFITHLVVDEAHRLGTATCKKLIRDLRAVNPDLKILAVTATPNRGDGQTLAYAVGEGVSFQITYAELIDLSILVPPRTFTRDLGLNAEIEALPKVRGDYDLDTIGSLLNREVHNEAVYEKWLEHAADRQTIGFCTTIAHAKALAVTFRSYGVVAEAVWGGMNTDDRDEILERFEAGTVQVIFNCMMLIEGYDAPLTACVMLLRPMLEEITFLQALGRGLRSLDPEIYPGITKTDCIILDFTGATDRHGHLEVRVREEREAAFRARNIGHASEETSIAVPKTPKKKLRHFVMREVNLLADVKQPFVFDSNQQYAVAHNNYAWAAAFYFDHEWHALARIHNKTVVHLGKGRRLDVVTAIDKFLRYDCSGTMPKDIREMPATPEQITDLQKRGISFDDEVSFYEAKCRLSIDSAMGQIRALLLEHHPYDFPMAA